MYFDVHSYAALDASQSVASWTSKDGTERLHKSRKGNYWLEILSPGRPACGKLIDAEQAAG